MWDVFRVSSDKLALCHLELMRKMNDLIREINKYGDEQVKIHRRVRNTERRSRMPGVYFLARIFSDTELLSSLSNLSRAKSNYRPLLSWESLQSHLPSSKNRVKWRA